MTGGVKMEPLRVPPTAKSKIGEKIPRFFNHLMCFMKLISHVGIAHTIMTDWLGNLIVGTRLQVKSTLHKYLDHWSYIHPSTKLKSQFNFC